MAKDDSYLTELILAIHHEVQCAVDYISDVAGKQGTELGKSSALMGIEHLRLKIPFALNLEQQAGKITTLKDQSSIAELQHNLATRRGFVVDRGAPGKMGLYSKIRVNLAKPALTETGETTAQSVVSTGEVEISFAPLKRE
jgi:hypothetical protein